MSLYLGREQEGRPIVLQRYSKTRFPIPYCDIQSYSDKRPASPCWRYCPTAFVSAV